MDIKEFIEASIDTMKSDPAFTKFFNSKLKEALDTKDIVGLEALLSMAGQMYEDDYEKIPFDKGMMATAAKIVMEESPELNSFILNYVEKYKESYQTISGLERMFISAIKAKEKTNIQALLAVCDTLWPDGKIPLHPEILKVAKSLGEV